MAGLLAFLGVAGPLGLLSGRLVGIADNGDGPRMACSARLVADVPDRTAPWHGVVVTDYRTGGPGCADPYPSSAAPLLRATVTDPDDPSGTWSLVRPGLLYSALLALGVALAAAVASARSRARVLVVAVPVLPLIVVPWWSRFFVSTYAEPAGLVGAAWVLLGGLAIAVTTPAHCRSRLAALGLVAVGGAVAGTAKPGFLPVAAAAVVVAAMTALRPEAGRRPAWRWTGPLVALGVVLACAVPVSAALGWEDRTDADVNAHNLVFTAVLTEVGPAAAPAVGLPPEAARRAGEGFYWTGARGIPGWAATIGTRPDEVRSAALGQLARHPGAALRVLDRGMTATMRPQLAYLSSAPRGTAPERDEHRTTAPEAGMLTAPQKAWLDGVGAGWLPAVVALAAAGAGLVTLRVGRDAGTRVALARGATVTAATAGAIVGLSVLGDGYFELTKHVWLASYLLVVTGLVLVTALVAWLVDLAGLRGATATGDGASE